MLGWEAGVGSAALELYKQGFLGWAGEVPCPFEGAVSASRALILLEEVKVPSGTKAMPFLVMPLF